MISPLSWPDVKTKYDATPMSVYRSVQTSGNNQPGGDSGGLFQISNIAMLSREIKLARTPVKRGNAMKKASVFQLNFKNITPQKRYAHFGDKMPAFGQDNTR